MKKVKNSLSCIVKIALCFIFSFYSVVVIDANASSGLASKIFMRYPDGKSKAFTMAFDDGRVEDRQLVELFQDYNMKATFYLNTGKLKSTSSSILSKQDAIDLYKDSGMEVGSHTATHRDLPDVYEKEGEAGLKKEILDDIAILESSFGQEIYGIAYPGAPPNKLNDLNVINYMKKNGVGFGRVISESTESKSFRLPGDFHNWSPTCHFSKIKTYSQKFINKKVYSDPILFYIWGHAYDFNDPDYGMDFVTFTDICYELKDQPDVWYCGNNEFYKYVTDFKKLEISEKNDTIKNPTNQSLWIIYTGTGKDTVVEIKAGQTVKGVMAGAYDKGNNKTESKPTVSNNTASKPTASKKPTVSNGKPQAEEAFTVEQKDDTSSIYKAFGVALDGIAKDFVVYDVDISKKAQGAQNISFNIPEGFGTNVAIYYIADTGFAKKLEAVLSEDKTTITASIDKDESFAICDVAEPAGTQEQKQGLMEKYWWLLVVVAVVVIGAVVAVIVLTKPKKS